MVGMAVVAAVVPREAIMYLPQRNRMLRRVEMI
jgi:hypothetical protein